MTDAIAPVSSSDVSVKTLNNETPENNAPVYSPVDFPKALYHERPDTQSHPNSLPPPYSDLPYNVDLESGREIAKNHMPWWEVMIDSLFFGSTISLILGLILCYFTETAPKKAVSWTILGVWNVLLLVFLLVNYDKLFVKNKKSS
ncbi:hypothetical protein SOMG_01931 [Schizosaccharomyces osmophilus]|uniref:Uncharacterized protein n=1 Tax=Schizosaccharomyces osmophilus TaxID=2545709 RepID=A0AAE9W697_9SCHI|nr:uncharacterized protein SOMG_01931 [Schizosaccharomyces osmophilus]WBW70856.1 hypothetical protein SOMG_01931 [Schizosaccharomyces osmophilus]